MLSTASASRAEHEQDNRARVKEEEKELHSVEGGRRNKTNATAADSDGLRRRWFSSLFLASFCFTRAHSPSPSGCSALTGGFSRVMTATPPSISRVAVGGEAILKRHGRKKKRKEMARAKKPARTVKKKGKLRPRPTKEQRRKKKREEAFSPAGRERVARDLMLVT